VLIDADPGFAVSDIQIRIRPGNTTRLMVNDLVPLEAVVAKIEMFLAQYQQAAQQIEIGIADIRIGNRGGSRC
jgi:hypothetical protein